jgi:hypothetical protein
MFRLLFEENRSRPFQGSILELGRQAISFGRKDLQKWAGHSASFKGTRPAGNFSGDRRGDEIDDKDFFRFLGFQEVFSCDASSYENPTFVLDLNHPVPEELHNRFDVVLDGGTMEHIFNIPAVLANIHAMLKVGGRAIHITPSSNMVDHGFYSFSPTLFRDYYGANGYHILTVSLFECVSWSGEFSVFDCLSGELDNRLGRIANAKMAGVFCVVEKSTNATSHIIPAQSHFSRLWKDSEPNESRTGPNPLASAIRSNAPWLAEFLYWTRALAWRTPLVRRAAMPPRKY